MSDYKGSGARFAVAINSAAEVAGKLASICEWFEMGQGPEGAVTFLVPAADHRARSLLLCYVLPSQHEVAAMREP